ncbi:MAG: elongation factor G [Candidatus Hodgkinia cicadicola]
MIKISSRRNFGIMAHIDAGKTTVTERLLFYSGRLHSLGEVHEGTAAMDWMEQEQERGITITSASTSFRWQSEGFGSANLNIIDTPGHIDFTAEVERSLRVLDGAVIVLDATAGVEPQTEAVWNQVNRYGLAKLIFCNKMDKFGSDYDLCLETLRTKLNAFVLPIQIPIIINHEFVGVIDIINMLAMFWDCKTSPHKLRKLPIPAEFVIKANQVRERLINLIIERDAAAMTSYLQTGCIESKHLIGLIRLATIAGEMCPVLCGSAFKNKALQPLLDAIVNFLPSPDDVPPALNYDGTDFRFANCSDALTAIVFKITNDDYVNNLSYTRIYAGVIFKGNVVLNSRTKEIEKVIKIFKMHANIRSEVSFAVAGDIVAVAGLKKIITGDTLCDISKPIDLFKMQFPVPVIQIALEPETNSDQEKLILALKKLVSEDPTLSFNTSSQSGQIILAGMGELHLEVTIDRITREYSFKIKTTPPQVAYKETIARTVVEEYTHKKQSGGSGQFAKVKIMFSQIAFMEHEFESKLTGGVIPKEFIPSVKRGLEEAFACGPASGFPVIKIKATLIDGDYHEVDSSTTAFEIAAKLCYKQAITNAGAIILEPTMRLEVITPSDCVSSVICDLITRRSQILLQTIDGINVTAITCLTPLALLFKYIDSLRSLSKGRATYSMKFECYSALGSGAAEVRKA